MLQFSLPKAAAGARDSPAALEAHPTKMPAAPEPAPFYCPHCQREVSDPLTCGDCSAVICRQCGTPLESPADLGMG